MDVRQVWDLAARFAKLATNKAYEAGFKDGTFDIANDQWGSPVESWNHFLHHHEKNKTVEEWMHDVKSYKQGYNDAAFSSEKKQEINKGFWDLPGADVETTVRWMKPHKEEGETSFEGLLDEEVPRTEQNAVARVQRAVNVSDKDALDFVREVGPDAVFQMSYDEIRYGKGYGKPSSTASFAARFEKLATQHRMISQPAAFRLLEQHGVDISDPAEMADFEEQFGEYDEYPEPLILDWLQEIKRRKQEQDYAKPEEWQDWRADLGSPYFDSAKGFQISKKRVLKELRNHGHGIEEMAQLMADLGDKETYDAQEVLRWLGY
jgi:hypothetical protein